MGTDSRSQKATAPVAVQEHPLWERLADEVNAARRETGEWPVLLVSWEGPYDQLVSFGRHRPKFKAATQREAGEIMPALAALARDRTPVVILGPRTWAELRVTTPRDHLDLWDLRFMGCLVLTDKRDYPRYFSEGPTPRSITLEVVDPPDPSRPLASSLSRPCPTCEPTGHTGVWDGRRFLTCQTCGDRGELPLQGTTEEVAGSDDSGGGPGSFQAHSSPVPVPGDTR